MELITVITGLDLASENTGRAYWVLPPHGPPRWLLPAEPLLRRAGLRLCSPQRLGGLIQKQLMYLGLLRGHVVWLAERSLKELERALARFLDEQDVRLAFYFGTPGAYSKTTVQVMRPDGAVLAYAKLAATSMAHEALRAEQRNLGLLANVTALQGRVPEAWGWIEWDNTCILLTSPGPQRSGPGKFGKLHMEFLQILYQAFSQEVRFDESSIWLHLTTTLEGLCPELALSWQSRYKSALGILQDRLGGLELSVSLAHRDFTPWNTCLAAHNTLYVFDWEFAHLGWSPFWDYFHYHLMSRLLLKGPVDSRHARAWLARLPKVRGIDPCLLFLAYLVDIGLFYHEALFARGSHSDDAVLHQVALFLDSLEEWSQ